jgi:hypothetical protein
MTGSDLLTKEANKAHNTYWMLHCAQSQRNLSVCERNLKMAIEVMLRARCDYMAVMYRESAEKARESYLNPGS